MSKTIKERAVRFGCIAKEKSLLKKDVCNDEFREFWDNVSLSQPNGVLFRGIPEYVSEVCCQAYITGATEQRKIDIEKACEWLEIHSFEFIELVSLHGVGADCSKIIKMFKKAMEEE